MGMTVEDVVRSLRAQGDVGKNWFHTYEDPQPIGEAELERLCLPDGSALPRDLVQWLRYDAAWFPLLDDARTGLRAEPLRSVLNEWAEDLLEDEDDDLAEDEGFETPEQVVEFWIGILPTAELIDRPVVRLPSGDQDCLLVLESGRDALRVLGCHKRIEFWWKYETFAGYLAHWLGFEEPE